MRRWAVVVAALVALAAAALAVWRSEPVWLDRLRDPLRYETILTPHARNYDLDPALLAALVYTESRFRADARSSAGAIGLMQLLPETGEAIALRTGGDR